MTHKPDGHANLVEVKTEVVESRSADEMSARFYDLFEGVIFGEHSAKEAEEQLRSLATSAESRALLCDTFTCFASLSLNDAQKAKARTLGEFVAHNFCPPDYLKAEASLMSTADSKTKVIKCRTKTYFKQTKFNLLREESEGYAKLVSELLAGGGGGGGCGGPAPDALYHRLSLLIGQFNLDPNRVVDLVLEAFACDLTHSAAYLSVVRRFQLGRAALRDMVLLKFRICERAGRTPNSWYRAVAILCVHGLLERDHFFPLLQPSQPALAEDAAQSRALLKRRAAHAQKISTLAAMELQSQTPSTSAAALDAGLPSGSGGSAAQVTFESAVRAQLREDEKMAAQLFDERVVLGKNQKLGFLVACLEIGAWSLAKDLFNVFPGDYVLGKSKRCRVALTNLLGHVIEPFYRLRLSKDTVRLVGRQLGKLCLNHPTIALDYLLGQVQTFQNLIEPIVESLRYLSDLAVDVLTYCIIENLADPAKQSLKTGDGNLSSWLASLGQFTGAVYKRYTMEYEGLLQYVVNQLKAEKSVDLLVLREVISAVGGFESTSNLTEEQVQGLMGGELLRQEAMGSAVQRSNRKPLNRLRDALHNAHLSTALAILIAQQADCIVHREARDLPLKLAGQMLDECQTTFLQFVNFLRANLKLEEYTTTVPHVTDLLQTYGLAAPAAFHVVRPACFYEATAKFDLMKKFNKETTEKKKLDQETKAEICKEAFGEVWRSVEEELCKVMPDNFWKEISATLYTVFWILNLNDICVSPEAYKREVEKVQKQIDAVSMSDSSKKRQAKEVERLKSLETKLNAELAKQEEHVSRMKSFLVSVKENFFASGPNIQMMRFLQCCVLPRATFSEADAIFAANFVVWMHQNRTGYFHTIVALDKLFFDVNPLLLPLTEVEAGNLGKLFQVLLEQALHWHSDEAVFQAECQGFPGCLTKVRNAKSGFDYATYMTVCFKWQTRLFRSVHYALTEGSYLLCRNTIIVMKRILNQFPILKNQIPQVEQAMVAVRDREKGKREDLSVMANAYITILKRRRVKVHDSDEFSGKKKEPKDATPTKTPAPPRSKSQDNAVPPKKARSSAEPSTITKPTEKTKDERENRRKPNKEEKGQENGVRLRNPLISPKDFLQHIRKNVNENKSVVKKAKNAEKAESEEKSEKEHVKGKEAKTEQKETKPANKEVKERPVKQTEEPLKRTPIRDGKEAKNGTREQKNGGKEPKETSKEPQKLREAKENHAEKSAERNGKERREPIRVEKEERDDKDEKRDEFQRPGRRESKDERRPSSRDDSDRALGKISRQNSNSGLEETPRNARRSHEPRSEPDRGRHHAISAPGKRGSSLRENAPQQHKRARN